MFGRRSNNSPLIGSAGLAASRLKTIVTNDRIDRATETEVNRARQEMDIKDFYKTEVGKMIADAYKKDERAVYLTDAQYQWAIMNVPTGDFDESVKLGRVVYRCMGIELIREQAVKNVGIGLCSALSMRSVNPFNANPPERDLDFMRQRFDNGQINVTKAPADQLSIMDAARMSFAIASVALKYAITLHRACDIGYYQERYAALMQNGSDGQRAAVLAECRRSHLNQLEF